MSLDTRMVDVEDWSCRLECVSSSDGNPYQPISTWYGAEVLLIAQVSPQLGVPNTKLKADIFLGYHEVIMTKERRQRYQSL